MVADMLDWNRTEFSHDYVDVIKANKETILPFPFSDFFEFNGEFRPSPFLFAIRSADRSKEPVA